MAGVPRRIYEGVLESGRFESGMWGGFLVGRMGGGLDGGVGSFGVEDELRKVAGSGGFSPWGGSK